MSKFDLSSPQKQKEEEVWEEEEQQGQKAQLEGQQGRHRGQLFPHVEEEKV